MKDINLIREQINQIDKEIAEAKAAIKILNEEINELNNKYYESTNSTTTRG